MCCWCHGVEHGIKKQAANGAIKEEINLIRATKELNVSRLTLTDYVKKKAGVAKRCNKRFQTIQLLENMWTNSDHAFVKYDRLVQANS